MDVLVTPAIENDRLATLAELVLQTCRERRIVLPAPAALERLCAHLRHQARREVHRRLSHGLSAEQRKCLDALTRRRDDTGQNWLTWRAEISGRPNVASASSSASMQNAASIVFDTRHDSTRRVAQSITATR